MVESIFDDIRDADYGRARGDPNAYTTGVIGDQHVVLVHCPRMASNSAASVSTWLKASFTEIKLIMVVGICGAVPNYEDEHQQNQEKVFLGDLLISTAVIQFDLGRQESHNFQMKSHLDGLGRPGLLTSGIMAKLQTRKNRAALSKDLKSHLQALQVERPGCTSYPGVRYDRLYCAQNCTDLGCGDQYHELRVRHEDDTQPSIHFGIFGSSNSVLRSGAIRDKLAMAHRIIGFEMESSGTWDVCQTIVIKAVSDYADNHKNDVWRKYAAAVAAAGLKAFLAKTFLTKLSLSDNVRSSISRTISSGMPFLQFENWYLPAHSHATANISSDFAMLAYGPEKPTNKRDATIHVHYLKDGTVKHKVIVKDETQVRSLSFDRQGKLLASSHGGYWYTPWMGNTKRLPVRIRLWCMETGFQEWICKPHERSTLESPLINMSFNSEGDRLAAVYSSNDLPNAERPSFFVIDASKGDILYKDDGDLSGSCLGLFLPDDRHYFVCSGKKIVIFNADNAEGHKKVFPGITVLDNAMATLNPNGNLLITHRNGDLRTHSLVTHSNSDSNTQFLDCVEIQKFNIESHVSFGKATRIIARFSETNELVIVVTNHHSQQLCIALPNSRRCKIVPSNGHIAQILSISHDGQYLAWLELMASTPLCKVRVCNIQEELRDASLLCSLDSMD